MPRPCFHKLVLPTTVQSRQLRIPDNFLRKYGGELSSVATISVPDGSVWRVGLKKADNKYWFVDGWPEFVQRYSIGVGYFLVFRYEGKSSFSIHIFNLGTSEINYQAAPRSSNEWAYFANRLKIFEEMEDEDYNESAAGNTQPALQNLFNASKLNRVNWGEGGNALSSRDIGVQFNALEFKKSTDELKLRASFEEKAKKSAKKKRKSEGPETSDEHEEETEMRIRFYESASARKRTVTAEEREKAVNEAKAFEPANPFCRVVLRPSYLYRGCIMYLPSCFAEKHLNGVSGFIKLQLPDGKEWPVRCLYRSGRAKLSQGWFEFALDNNLGEGDVCVFELLRMKEVVLQVTIFRVTEDEELLSPPLLPQNQHVNQAKLLRTPMQQHHLATSKLIRN